MLITVVAFLGAQTPGASQIRADSAMKAVDDMMRYLWNRNHDSTYITSYNDKLNVRILGISKYNFFAVRDHLNDSRLVYTPEFGLNFGIGVTYNWFSIDAAFNVGLRQDKIPNSKFFDFQGNVFSSKFLVEGTLKYYYGFELTGASGVADEMNQVRPDIRTINFGLSFLYALRYDRFSLKAPFVFSEVQRKSAGSPIFGITFNFFTMDADSSVVNPPNQPDFSYPLSTLTGTNMLSLSVNAGYMYSFVYKERIFLSVGITPGLMIAGGDYATDFRENRGVYVSWMTKGLAALGYNGSRWYGGIQALSDINIFRLDKQMVVNSTHGKGRFYFGYRIQ